MTFEINLEWVKHSPEAALSMIDRLMVERDEAQALAKASAAGFVEQGEVVKRLLEALEPFAACAEELDGDQDVPRAPDGEWAKFRLLTDDYRRARAALALAKGRGDDHHR